MPQPDKGLPGQCWCDLGDVVWCEHVRISGTRYLKSWLLGKLTQGIALFVDVAVPSKTFATAPVGAWVGPGMYFTIRYVLCHHEL